MSSPNQTLGPAALFCAVSITVCHTAPAAAGEPKSHHVFDDGVGVYFLNIRDGAKAIVEDGPNGFFDRLTLLEMALRLGRDLNSTDVEAQRARFKKFVSRNVREWSQAEKEELLATVKSAHGMCKDSLPELLPGGQRDEPASRSRWRSTPKWCTASRAWPMREFPKPCALWNGLRSTSTLVSELRPATSSSSRSSAYSSKMQ